MAKKTDGSAQCDMVYECKKGLGICCYGCVRFSSCGESCANHPSVCGLSVRPSMTCASSFSGSRLLSIRERQGMSRAELAARLKVRTAQVKTWEYGERKPYQKMQERICTAVGCRLVDLRE